MSVSAYWMQGVALALFVTLLLIRRVVDRGRLVHRSSGNGAAPDVVVRDRRSGRELWFEEGTRRLLHARISSQNPLVSRLPYVDGLHLHMEDSISAGHALFIGCGAGIGPRQFAQLYPDMAIDVVDVDPRVFEIAARFFSFAPSPTLATHVTDGRQFLERTDQTFDRIVVDVFGANDMPASLCTQEFFRLCKAKLSQGGACVVNVAGAVDGPHSTLARAIHAGITEAFGGDRVRVYAVPRGRERRPAPRRRRNLLMFAFASEPPPDPALVRQVPPIVPALATLPAHRISFAAGVDPLSDRALVGPRLPIE